MPSPRFTSENAPRQGGKPGRVRNPKLHAAEQSALARLEGIVATVVAKAEAGDLAACKIVLDRVWPVPRHGDTHLQILQTVTTPPNLVVGFVTSRDPPA